MKQNGLLFLLIFFLCSFTASHKFYVSVTEVEHNEKENSLQIISRVFTDDLENVLQVRYDPDLRLGKKIETEGAEVFISKYLKSKFEVVVDGKPVEAKYLGKEYENDMTIFYIEAPQVSHLKNIKIRNTVLMDLFDDQKNLIHVSYKGKTKSLILADGKEEDVLKFNP